MPAPFATDGFMELAFAGSVVTDHAFPFPPDPVCSLIPINSLLPRRGPATAFPA
jgi:hypothetical protein